MNRSRAGLAAFFNLTGTLHFVIPRSYEAMVPEPVPAKEAVAVSGVAEILGGLGLILPQTRRLAAWGLIALFIAVFPANVNMAVNHLPFNGKPVEPALLWARLPLQLVLIAWAAWYARPTRVTAR